MVRFVPIEALMKRLVPEWDSDIDTSLFAPSFFVRTSTILARR